MRLGGPTDKVVGTVEEYGTYNHDGRLLGGRGSGSVWGGMGLLGRAKRRVSRGLLRVWVVLSCVVERRMRDAV